MEVTLPLCDCRYNITVLGVHICWTKFLTNSENWQLTKSYKSDIISFVPWIIILKWDILTDDKNFWDFFKKVLDKFERLWYNNQAVEKNQSRTGRKNLKKVEKNPKKYLTREEECDILIGLSGRGKYRARGRQQKIVFWKLNNERRKQSI